MSYPRIIANWKMNGSKEAIKKWLDLFSSEINSTLQKECLLCPPAIYLTTARDILEETGVDILLGAQNLDINSSHPQTGGISSSMLKDIGCEFVIIGHSERRTIFNEDSSLLRAKVISALEEELKVVFCIGETKKEKEQNIAKDLIQKQLYALKNIYQKNVLIAYEPLWAIGTGEIPSENYLNDMHAFIKDELKYLSGQDLESSVYYGGSINVDNANDLMKLDCVDGLLIGGASLESSSFVQIVNKIYS